MKFTELYDRNIKYWGKNCDISDVVLSDDVGPYFSTLSALWSNVEDMVGHQNPWDELMIWSMWQVFHTEAEFCIKKNQKELIFEMVDKSKIQQRFYENLSSPTSDYLDLLPQYKNDFTHDKS